MTTLPDADDRLMATAMDAHWTWSDVPGDAAAANRAIVEAMLHVFAATESASVQNTKYRMGLAALRRGICRHPHRARLPQQALPVDQARRFRPGKPNSVFTPTDEPHGQIECPVAR